MTEGVGEKLIQVEKEKGPSSVCHSAQPMGEVEKGFLSWGESDRKWAFWIKRQPSSV